MKRLTLIGLVLLVTACGQNEQEGQEGVAAAPFKPTGDVKYTMQWVLDPAADHIWDSAGSIITEEGTRDLRPTTEEGWLAVQHSAVVVAEAGNLLMMPGRARENDDWREFALGLVDAGLSAKAAAEAQDADALFDAGGQIYRVCSSCHAVYVQSDEKPGIQGPEKAEEP